MAIPSKTFDVVRQYDSEIVKHCTPEKIGRYSVLRDTSILELPPEAKPMLFKCKALSRDQRRHIKEIESDSVRREMCFRYGVLSVHQIPSKTGGPASSWSPNREQPLAMLSDESLDALEALDIGDLDIEEVGAAIEARSFLAQGVRPSCQVLPSSQRAYASQVASLAEQKGPSEDTKEPPKETPA